MPGPVRPQEGTRIPAAGVCATVRGMKMVCGYTGENAAENYLDNQIIKAREM